MKGEQKKMFFERNFIKELIKNNDLFNLVSKYTKLKKRGKYYVGICPFHKENAPSFYLNPKTNKYHCYGCGASGNVINFVMELEKCDFVNAIQILAKQADMKMPDVKTLKISDDAKKAEILKINKVAARYFYNNLHQNGKDGLDYFQNQRKLSPSTMRRFGLGYSKPFGNDLYLHLISNGFAHEDIMNSGLISHNRDASPEFFDKFWSRVMFPIMDENNAVIGFGGRILGDGKPKYLNSPETIAFSKSNNLYGYNLAKHSNKPYIICCEGYMDVIAMHQAGFNNAVASLGTALTKEQVKLIAGYTDQVYLAYDSDIPGIKAALRACELCENAGLNIKIINMLPYKDPDEFIKNLGKEAFMERIDNAEDGTHFILKHIKEVSESDAEYENKICEILLG